MNINKFDEFLDYIIKERVSKVLRSKSDEYARGTDKLHNFHRAGRIRGVSAYEALNGMHVKHICSLYDMLEDLECNKFHPKSLWEEKFTDTINYYILLWALLEDSNYGRGDI